jgi:hypothetical protein
LILCKSGPKNQWLIETRIICQHIIGAYYKEKGVSTFDKTWAGTAYILGIVLLILGVLGIFLGCSAHFTLPPILGVLPAFVGWGIVKSVKVAWRASVYHHTDYDQGS